MLELPKVEHLPLVSFITLQWKQLKRSKTDKNEKKIAFFQFSEVMLLHSQNGSLRCIVSLKYTRRQVGCCS